jgi:hypothetical protein
MRREIACTVAAALISSASIAEERFLDRIEAPVRTVEGASVRQLSERARTCISQLVTYDSVVLRDTSRVSIMSPVPADTSGDTTAVAGGDVLRTVDLDAGLIIAQSRTPYSRMMMKHILESTITFEAKDGRFRITQTGIKAAMQSTGYAANTGFSPVRIQPGSGHEKIGAALLALSEKIGDCVETSAGADSADW